MTRDCSAKFAAQLAPSPWIVVATAVVPQWLLWSSVLCDRVVHLVDIHVCIRKIHTRFILLIKYLLARLHRQTHDQFAITGVLVLFGFGCLSVCQWRRWLTLVNLLTHVIVVRIVSCCEFTGVQRQVAMFSHALGFQRVSACRGRILLQTEYNIL